MWVWFKLQTLNLVHRTETKGSCKANSSTLVHTPLPALRAGESGQLAKPLSPSAQTYIRSQTQHAQDRTVSAASCLEILRTAHFLSQQQMGLLGAANSGQDGLRNSLPEDTLQSPPLALSQPPLPFLRPQKGMPGKWADGSVRKRLQEPMPGSCLQFHHSGGGDLGASLRWAGQKV